MAFEITDSNFAETIGSDKVTLIDFWAEWCGPCKMMGPHIDALSEQYKDRATVGKLNVDDNPEAPMQFNIRGIPTFLVFKNGDLKEKIVGAVSPNVLSAAIEKHL